MNHNEFLGSSGCYGGSPLSNEMNYMYSEFQGSKDNQCCVDNIFVELQFKQIEKDLSYPVHIVNHPQESNLSNYAVSTILQQILILWLLARKI